MVTDHAMLESQMWAAVNNLLPTLQLNEQRLVLDGTLIGIQDEPTPAQMQAAHVQPGNTLLGLCEIYAPPQPAVITLFSGPISRSDTDIVDVVQHELGHRLDMGFHGIPGMQSIVDGDGDMLCDHCAVPGSDCGCSSKTAAARVLYNYEVNEVNQVAAQRTGWSEDCPVCLVWSKLNEADGLLSNTSTETSLQHVIPAGLGGTIPLARFRVQQAYENFLSSASLVDPNTGMTDQLRTTLGQLQSALGGEGTILTVDQLRNAARIAHVAQLQAFQFAWSYWSAQIK